jgi:hypothetical protein
MPPEQFRGLTPGQVHSTIKSHDLCFRFHDSPPDFASTMVSVGYLKSIFESPSSDNGAKIHGLEPAPPHIHFFRHLYLLLAYFCYSRCLPSFTSILVTDIALLSSCPARNDLYSQAISKSSSNNVRDIRHPLFTLLDNSRQECRFYRLNSHSSLKGRKLFQRSDNLPQRAMAEPFRIIEYKIG